MQLRHDCRDLGGWPEAQAVADGKNGSYYTDIMVFKQAKFENQSNDWAMHLCEGVS